jgi:putative glutamine amidotransferase
MLLLLSQLSPPGTISFNGLWPQLFSYIQTVGADQLSSNYSPGLFSREVNMKPRIGLNLDFREGLPDQYVLNATYYEALVSAGAVPVLLAPSDETDLRHLISGLSGLVLTGGKDYDPSLYGESPGALIEPAHPVRQRFDVSLVRYCLSQTSIPLLGICAGHQLLNISLGGTLIQDIATELPESTVEHLNPGGAVTELSKHEVIIDAGSMLEKIYGDRRIVVTSSHHQAIQRLGHGLKISARAIDGVIESIELPSRPFTLGVQWHPERDINNHNVLFEAFVEACSVQGGYTTGLLPQLSNSPTNLGNDASLLSRLDYPA